MALNLIAIEKEPTTAATVEGSGKNTSENISEDIVTHSEENVKPSEDIPAEIVVEALTDKEETA